MPSFFKKNIGLSTIFIEVPQMGSSVITGLARNEDEKDRIIELVEDIPEISKVEERIHLRSDLTL